MLAIILLFTVLVLVVMGMQPARRYRRGYDYRRDYDDWDDDDDDDRPVWRMNTSNTLALVLAAVLVVVFVVQF